MLKVTLKLVEWLLENGHKDSLKTVGIEDGVDEAAVKAFTDEQKKAVKSAAGLAIVEGKLAGEVLKSLQTTEETKTGNALLDALGSMEKRFEAIEKRFETPGDKHGTSCKCDDCVEAGTKGAGDDEGDGEGDGDKGESGRSGKAVSAVSAELKSMFSRINANAMGDDDWSKAAGVESIDKLYDQGKSDLVYPAVKAGAAGAKSHPFAGQLVQEGGRTLQEASEFEQAKNGAWFKLLAYSQTGGKGLPANLKMTDRDHALINHALHNDRFGGCLRGGDSDEKGVVGIENQKLSPAQIKTVIDDTTSGGLEIAPIYFDDNVIKVPRLFGELYPFVNVTPITRGRRIESATLGNVTITSRGSVRDDQTIPLFNTNSFISAFDTTIHVCDGAIELGLDHMSDSSVDLGAHVTQSYGEALLEWLDTQIADGDGTTEPEGVMNASGTTSVTFSSTAPTIGGYEALLFGVPKRYKKGFQGSRIMFCSNETTYSRARGIPVGAADARRLFGMAQENYMMFEHNYAIVDAMDNNDGFFANLARYRMYRRMGLTMRISTEGKDLITNNKMLVTARARFGGQLEDGLAAAVATDMQA